MIKIDVCYLIVCLLGVLGLISLCFVGYGEDIAFELKDRKQTRFATKALQFDDGMMKCIQKLVKIEYRSEKTKDHDRLRVLHSQRKEIIDYLYCVLADTKEDTDFKISYINTLCKMKAMIKNYYQAGKYKQAADNTIAYLEDCEKKVHKKVKGK